ncbi:hypothetical protein GCM10007863_33860 [Dyella mobilis]|nr:hypothetical protein GCM10007863_33860 [Dyella mobilis]
MRAQSGDIDGFAGHIGHQLFLSGTIFAHDHGVAREAQLGQRRFDFAELDTVAADLDLGVDATEIVQSSIGPPARQVAGAIHAFALRKRMRHEALGAEPRAVQVAARQSVARDIQLSGDTDRLRLQAVVQHVELRVPDRPANGDAGRAAHVLGNLVRAAAHGGFGGAVFVDQAHLRVPALPECEVGGQQGFAAQQQRFGGSLPCIETGVEQFQVCRRELQQLVAARRRRVEQGAKVVADIEQMQRLSRQQGAEQGRYAAVEAGR